MSKRLQWSISTMALAGASHPWHLATTRVRYTVSPLVTSTAMVIPILPPPDLTLLMWSTLLWLRHARLNDRARDHPVVLRVSARACCRRLFHARDRATRNGCISGWSERRVAGAGRDQTV